MLGNIKENKFIYGFIVIFSFFALILLIANPSYYSHDELQKLDHVLKYGFYDYIRHYVTISTGGVFGTPVRPFSFLIQGVLALCMQNFPVVVHFFAVILHSVIACLLFSLVVSFGGDRKLGILASIIFIVSPTSIIATGWSAALMDRMYVFFAVAALLCVKQYITDRKSHSAIVIVFIFSSLGILSKETFVITPFLMLFLLVTNGTRLRNTRLWLAVVSWILPITIFIAIRFAALESSFGSPSTGSYQASIANVPDGLLVYAAYPFLITLTEAINWVFVPHYKIVLAIFAHGLVILFVWRLYSLRLMFCYICFYLLPLIPILLIPLKAAHYLYGSGTVFSVAIAAIIYQSYLSRSRIIKCLSYALVVLLIIHSYVIQGFIYAVGTCMNRTMISMTAAYLGAGRPMNVVFQAEPDAPEHILYRIVTGRNQIGPYSPVKFNFAPYGAHASSSSLNLVMESSCYVYDIK